MINKSISNICWKYEDTFEIMTILKENGFKYIEIAPIEIIDDWNDPNIEKMQQFKGWLDLFELKVCSIQGVFYKTNLNIYEDIDACISHFQKVKQICDLFECRYVVFGAAGARKFPSYFSQDQKDGVMKNFFDKVKEEFNIEIGLEASPKKYGANFCNTYEEIVQFQKRCDIKIHFDFGCANVDINTNSYDFESIDINSIRNIHISLPGMKTLEGTEPFRDIVCDNKELASKFLSIEMKKSSIYEVQNSLKIFEKWSIDDEL